MSKTGNHPVAVIDLGSSAIRIIVAEKRKDASFKILDRAEKPLSMGKDVFSTGYIGRETMKQILEVLLSFKELLKGWKIADEDIRVIATSALREAKNKETFVDKMALRTGFVIQVVDGIDETRLTYLAVESALHDLKETLSRTNALIIEVGGGSTDLMLLHRRKMQTAHSFNIGTVRILGQQNSKYDEKEFLNTYLEENINPTLERLNEEFELKRVRYFIAIGGHPRVAARVLGKKGASGQYAIITKKDFKDFIGEIKEQNTEEIAERLELSLGIAEGFLPCLSVINSFLSKTNADELLIPNVSIRDGVLLSLQHSQDSDTHIQFASQVLTSAESLGRKFHYEEKHAKQVYKLAMLLFDQLQEEHCVSPHGRLLLQVAATLHDIGSFIGGSAHHKHGQYIIQNSEIFGLNQDDIKLVANIVRYHRKALPKSSHFLFQTLPSQKKIKVLKLAAILRMADALDRSHAGKIKSLAVQEKEDELLIFCNSQKDLTLEKIALKEKSDMFEEVFGLKVVAVRRNVKGIET